MNHMLRRKVSSFSRESGSHRWRLNCLRIQELEADLVAANAKSKSLLTDYSALEEELAQVKGKQAEVDL